jgi:hypothetical protein
MAVEGSVDVLVIVAILFEDFPQEHRLDLLITANIVPNSLTLVTLMMEALRSSVTSVLTRAT